MRLLIFVMFAPDPKKYGILDTTIDDIIAAHNEEGHLVSLLDSSVKHIHNMSFGWVLATAKERPLGRSYGGCVGRGNSLRAEAVGILSITIFVALLAKHQYRIDLCVNFVTDNL